MRLRSKPEPGAWRALAHALVRPAAHARLLAPVGLALLLAPMPASAVYKVEVEAPSVLRDILKAHLDLVRFADRADLSPDQFAYMVETVGDQVRQFASTEGYFDATTKASVEGEGDQRVVHITVDAGARTLIRRVDIGVEGPASQQAPAQVEALRKGWGLPAGQPFRQSDWDKAKSDGLAQLQARRYYGAKLAHSEARVEPDEQAADLTVRYASGPSYLLGPLRITGTRRYPERIIRNVNPLSVGEPYSAERLLELQRAIQRQPYFSNVQVDLEDAPPADGADTVTAPVNVRVREHPERRLSAGVGFTTDTGGQVSGRYSYYNLFNRAWTLDTQLSLEQKRQYGLVEVAMPPDSKAYRNSVYGSYEHTIDIENTDTTSMRTGLKRSRSRENYETTFSLDYYYDRLLPLGEQQQIARALVPAFAWTRRNVDNPVFPRRGNVINTQVGVALKNLLSDATFLRLYGRIRQYIPVGSRDLILARLELGADMTKADPQNVPATLRWRAGGTDSVRGYSFQSIGTQSGASVLPARYLGTASLEYQHWFRPEWGVAVFWDAGTATDNLHGITIFNGVGLGARWRSPVGPVELDVGYGIQKQQFRPHISLGVAF